jgi:hypothetical protein
MARTFESHSGRVNVAKLEMIARSFGWDTRVGEEHMGRMVHIFQSVETRGGLGENDDFEIGAAEGQTDPFAPPPPSDASRTLEMIREGVASLEEAARVLRLEKSSMEKPGAEKSVAEDEETGNDDGDMGGDAGAGPTTPFGSAARRMVRSASGGAVATKDPEVLLRRAQASARRLRRELCARRMQSAWRANVAKKKLLRLRVAKRQAESNQ